MQYNVKKIVIKQASIIFFLSSVIYSMDETSLLNCGLIDIFIPKDLVVLIKSSCTFQDISRLKCLNRRAYNYWEIENCSCFPGMFCFACQKLRQSTYHARTKVLAHYAQQKNRTMFQHIWSWQSELRDNDLWLFCRKDLSTSGLVIKMKQYDKNYGNAKEMDRVYCKQTINALHWGSDEPMNVLKQMLQGSGFNIYESVYRKKQAKKHKHHYDLSNILFYVKFRKDSDFLLAIIGGSIQANMFKSLFDCLSLSMINELHEKKRFSSDVVDHHGKLAADYYKEKMLYEQYKNTRELYTQTRQYTPRRQYAGRMGGPIR